MIFHEAAGPDNGDAPTSLSYACSVDRGIGPAVPLHAMIPIQLDRGALREDDGSVEQTCDGIESDEEPKEDAPFLASKTDAIPRQHLRSCRASRVISTYNNLFRKRLMEILMRTVEMMRKNSLMRNNSTLKAASALSTKKKCRPRPLAVAPRVKPMTTKTVTCEHSSTQHLPLEHTHSSAKTVIPYHGRRIEVVIPFQAIENSNADVKPHNGQDCSDSSGDYCGYGHHICSCDVTIRRRRRRGH